MLIHKVDGVLQVALEDQDLVDQPAVGHGANAGVEVLAQDVVRVALVLDDVAQALEFPASVKLLHHAGEVLTGDGRPADDAANRVACVGQVEQPARLVHRLPRLHGDGAVDARRRHRSLQIGGKKIAAQRGHLLVDPAILLGRVAPKVLVRINPLNPLAHTHLSVLQHPSGAPHLDYEMWVRAATSCYKAGP